MRIRGFRTGNRFNKGLSLVELMISMVIGLVVVGAVLVSYIASGRSGKFQAAYAQMNEDAQLALTMMSRDIQLAGYGIPVSVNGGGTAFVTSFTDRPITGCDTGFVASPAVPAAVPSVATCNATGSPAFEVGYEADLLNTVPTGAGRPSDCLGNGFAAADVPPYIVRNRYYLAANPISTRVELYCSSNKTAGGQPLIENVDAMKVWYGESDGAKQVVRYVPAVSVADWNNVLAVRVCVVIRSAERVVTAEEPMNYLDCDGISTAVGVDGLLRRSYLATATLRTKMPD